MDWISVKESLPNESMDVIVLRDNEVDTDRFIGSGDNGYFYNYLGITHWMPLPEKPEL